MPKLVVLTDLGVTVRKFDCPPTLAGELEHAICLQPQGQIFLDDLRHALTDTIAVQEGEVSERSGTFAIKRYYRDGRDTEVVHTGLSLKTARDHVAGPDARGDGWHDSLEPEYRSPKERSERNT